ncbi:MAG: radical SAM protein [Firmicutes bacterium]|nr:radical SAM protein [Bacillota bacterium]MDD4263883.1 radical SAM protein [Bacillota bacterium]
MRVSIGTAGILGLRRLKQICPPKTAYLLTDGKCKRNCKFCGNSDQIARVTWPHFDKERILTSLKNADVERICLQTVESKEAMDEVKELLPEIIDLGIPVCLSSQFGEEFLKIGLDRWTIPLDVVKSDSYRQIKGGSFEKILAKLKTLAAKYENRIGTHIIAGLGETEEEVIVLLDELYRSGINVGLFAFTPVVGTDLESHPKIALDSYRRIQIGNFLVSLGSDALQELAFEEGKLVSAPLFKVESKAFQTWGCEGCNRPFYNESPKGPWYNYPRELTKGEFQRALKESKL